MKHTCNDDESSSLHMCFTDDEIEHNDPLHALSGIIQTALWLLLIREYLRWGTSSARARCVRSLLRIRNRENDFPVARKVGGVYSASYKEV